MICLAAAGLADRGSCRLSAAAPPRVGRSRSSGLCRPICLQSEGLRATEVCKPGFAGGILKFSAIGTYRCVEGQTKPDSFGVGRDPDERTTDGKTLRLLVGGGFRASNLDLRSQDRCRKSVPVCVSIGRREDQSSVCELMRAEFAPNGSGVRNCQELGLAASVAAGSVWQLAGPQDALVCRRPPSDTSGASRI